MREVIILTVANKPRLPVPANCTAQDIRLMVARLYGWVCIGVQHSWCVPMKPSAINNSIQ
ncbi:MAG TPA: hypothetical protein V6C81_13150 [Planktothrix sp.]|jgi:hypothetical protein